MIMMDYMVSISFVLGLKIHKNCPYLTYSPAKNQPFALIRKFNFEITSISVSKLWCLKCIDISLTLIWTPLWGPGGPKVPKMEKPGTLVLNNFRWKSPVML